MAFKKEILEIIEPKDIFVGKTDAPITLMEFGEYENEDCAKQMKSLSNYWKNTKAKSIQFPSFPAHKDPPAHESR
jgi:protein-disulfide isomerase